MAVLADAAIPSVGVLRVHVLVVTVLVAADQPAREGLRADVHDDAVDGGGHALALEHFKAGGGVVDLDAERLGKLEKGGSDRVGRERLHCGGESHHALGAALVLLGGSA